uniref:Pre-rRNA-processing protein TSR2 n=1 Tax=Davidia involucrata TaxID=16924 RepID=A0A5B7AGI8_DAVIN
MESINRNGVVTPSRCLKPEAVSRLRQGISVHLSRWNGLQMAVKNEWGGRDSLKKSEQLAADILSWFSQSKALLCVEDLESLLHESLLLTFNTEIEDGSIEEVAEQLMIMHEEYLQGNH